MPARRPTVRRRARRRAEAKFTTTQLRAAYRLYTEGAWSLKRLGLALWQKHGYASPQVCANSLRLLFIREGWPIRTHREANRLAQLRHGRAVNRRGRSREARATKAAYERWRDRQKGHVRPCPILTASGRPCRSFAQHGESTCRAHARARMEAA